MSTVTVTSNSIQQYQSIAFNNTKSLDQKFNRQWQAAARATWHARLWIPSHSFGFFPSPPYGIPYMHKWLFVCEGARQARIRLPLHSYGIFFSHPHGIADMHMHMLVSTYRLLVWTLHTCVCHTCVCHTWACLSHSRACLHHLRVMLL